jgi:purine-binding chemotaxis protein CheW
MRVPKAPTFIAGAVSMEGNVIPVVDLAKKIELGDTTVNDKTKLIVLQVGQNDDVVMIGVLIDSVLDVVEIQTSKLLPPVLESMGFNTQTLDGMYKVGEDFFMIINAEKVFEKELANLI